MKRAMSWAAGIAATFGGGAAMAQPPALAPIPHVAQSDQGRVMRTMGRLYDMYVRRDIGIPDAMKPAGRNYDSLKETVTDKDKVHKLCCRFEMDGDELNRAFKVEVTGSHMPGEKLYTFFVRKSGREEVYATGATREMQDGKKAAGTYWTLALFDKNSMRFGWEPEDDRERKKIKRITWVERPVSETGEEQRPHFVMQLRAKSTDWGWQQQGIYDQKYLEELLDKQPEGGRRYSGR